MGFLLSFFFIIKSNNIFFLIVLQDKYNISVLTVNMKFMWLGTKRLERIYTVNCYVNFVIIPKRLP